MAQKYNTQKHTTGRMNNARKAPEQINIIYDLIKTEDIHISIDSEFHEYNHEELKLKNVYANIYGEEIIFLQITDEVEIDCDFMDNIQVIYDICRNTRIDIIENYIQTLVCPSQYDAASRTQTLIPENKGYYQEISQYEVGKSRDKIDFIWGHSQHLGFSDWEGIDLNLISNMTHFEFYKYFSILKYVR